jgi:flagellar biosynthesis GTPase FlhF
MDQARFEQEYARLLATPADSLEEGVAFALRELAGERLERARAWIAFAEQCRALEGDLDGPEKAAVIVAARQNRRAGYAAAYLIARGAAPEQIDRIPLAPLPGFVSRAEGQNIQGNLSRALRAAAAKLPEEIGRQVLELAEPRNVMIIAGVFGAWAAAHAFGAGALADVLVAAFGVAVLGLDAIRAARLLYTFLKKVQPVASDADIEEAAVALAEAITLIGVSIVSSVLLGRAFAKARTALKEAKAAKGGDRAPGPGRAKEAKESARERAKEGEGKAKEERAKEGEGERAKEERAKEKEREHAKEKEREHAKEKEREHAKEKGEPIIKEGAALKGAATMPGVGTFFAITAGLAALVALLLLLRRGRSE